MRYLVAIFLLWTGTAVAQPVCTTAAPAAIACLAPAVLPRSTDIVYGQQASGPSRSNQSVQFSLAQINSILLSIPNSWSGSNTFTGPISTQIGISITTSGALCNGVTDDTSAINTYLATLTNGGTVYVPAGKMCLINSANLSVPKNVILVGAAGGLAGAPAYTLSGTTGFILNPSYTVMMATGSQLRDLVIRASGMIANPTAAQVISAVAAWGASSSVGVTIPTGATNGVVLDRDFILGFNTAVSAKSGKFSISHLQGDTYNGIDVSHVGDVSLMDDIRFEPFYAINTSSTSGSWARPGIAFNFHDGNTLGGGALTRPFSFMYANAVKMENQGVTAVHGGDFEWNAAFGNGITGTVGVRFISGCAGCTVDTSFIAGFDTGFSDEVANSVAVGLLNIAGGTTASVYLSGQSATPTVSTWGGTPAAGDTASITITSASVTGSPVTLTYTAIAGDTTATVAEHVSQIINRTQALIAARFSAATSGSTTTVYWPADVTATSASASTGSVTHSDASGTACCGSDGTISNVLLTSPPTPAIVIGNTAGRANAWTISLPNITNGTIPLPSGWLQWNSPTSGSVHGLTLVGIQWSKWPNASQLSACGTSPSLSGSVFDDEGTIIEGTTSTGCTVTFVTPYPFTPSSITITNWAGNTSQVSISALSATGFTVTNSSATGNKFSFVVRP